MEGSVSFKDLPGLSFTENTFLAFDQLIGINPKVDIPSVYETNTGLSIGPFRQGLTAIVPIWFALELRRLDQCFVIPPDWFREEVLDALLQAEKASDELQPVHFYYIEIGKALLQHCRSDLHHNEDPVSIATALRSVEQVRIDKIRSKFKPMNDQDPSRQTIVKLTNISAAEITIIRAGITTLAQTSNKLRQTYSGEAYSVLLKGQGNPQRPTAPSQPRPTGGAGRSSSHTHSS